MKIAVYGSGGGSIPDWIKEEARKVGREIARRGHELVTGGCPGIPYYAVLGAHELNGRCIGFSPATDLENHVRDLEHPTEGFSDFIFVPKNYKHTDNRSACLYYRNISSGVYIDAAVIIRGNRGTMSEFLITYSLGKNIGILQGSGGITTRIIKEFLEDTDQKKKTKIIWDHDPVSLVDRLIKSLE